MGLNFDPVAFVALPANAAVVGIPAVYLAALLLRMPLMLSLQQRNRFGLPAVLA